MTDYTDTLDQDHNERRKRCGAGLGLAVILAGFFWIGVVASVVA